MNETAAIIGKFTGGSDTIDIKELVYYFYSVFLPKKEKLILALKKFKEDLDIVDLYGSTKESQISI